ncbi:MAG TPA: type IV toxin-antitoxin system AbiEi family antitoxin domain-containing protein [Solirubrobacteraceae bacterium]|nr:type IV toxin-antitoxin system AbiEi family antitoxin domain-containing protein [Solirubrobacteraceae bacterium]
MHRIAGRQNGVVAARQLLACGFTTPTVSRWVKAGRLFRKHQGVYAVGRPDLSQAGVFHAAVLAVGDDAVLSHRSAAILHGFWKSEVSVVEVTVPRRVPSRRGIRVHCVRELPHATRRQGIPVTTPAQTLLDLAVAVGPDELFARAVHEAEVQRRVTPALLRAEIDRNPRHRGCGRLEGEIADGPKPARSGLEIRVLDVLRRGKYPPFETNARIPGLPRWVEVDFYFPAQRLVIEADGGQFHDTPYRRKRDARKQAILEAAGLRVIRLRWEDTEADTLPQTEARLGHALLQL